MSYCMCGSPDCFSCGPAQGFHIHRKWCVGPDGTYECGQRDYEELLEEEEEKEEEE